MPIIIPLTPDGHVAALLCPSCMLLNLTSGEIQEYPCKTHFRPLFGPFPNTAGSGLCNGQVDSTSTSLYRTTSLNEPEVLRPAVRIARTGPWRVVEKRSNDVCGIDTRFKLLTLDTSTGSFQWILHSREAFSTQGTGRGTASFIPEPSEHVPVPLESLMKLSELPRFGL